MSSRGFGKNVPIVSLHKGSRRAQKGAEGRNVGTGFHVRYM